MYSIFTNMGPEVPLALLLMGLLGLRAKVWPKASILIRATPEKVFALIDMEDGKREDWGRTIIETEKLAGETGQFRKTYSTTLTNGISKSFSALFSIRSRVEPHQLVIQREGLEGRSLNNELLSQTYTITPEGQNSRLQMIYEWGPRPMIAQLVARADIWGGIYRIKGMAETGVAVEGPYQFISAGVAVITGLLSLAAFSVFLGWFGAALLTLALFVHELGHLVAYRMMGQPWGRMIFLPFLGALAIPRLPFETQGQLAFAALMGPGFSVLLAAGCVLVIMATGLATPGLIYLGIITALLNLFNLLPVEPLDGGVALRTVLSKYLGKNARFGLIAIGLVLAGIGFYLSQIVLVIFGGIAVLLNFQAKPKETGLSPLSRLGVFVACSSYISMIAVYLCVLYYFVFKQ